MGYQNKKHNCLKDEKNFSITTVIREIYRGKTINRAIQNSTIKGYKLPGKVADFGTRDGQSSIYRFTADALNLKLIEAGFKSWEIIEWGYGSLTLATFIIQKRLNFKTIISLFFLLAVFIDFLFFAFGPKNKVNRITTMGYIIFAKP